VRRRLPFVQQNARGSDKDIADKRAKRDAGLRRELICEHGHWTRNFLGIRAPHGYLRFSCDLQAEPRKLLGLGHKQRPDANA
jgi:hypothetical protein